MSWKRTCPIRSVGPDREERRAHHLREHLAEWPVGLAWPVYVEGRALDVERQEERQALHVVPVEMGQERGAVECPLARHPVGTQARAEVEEERRLIGRLEHYA